ncbi:hypothetical protein [Nonomuraea phyllanthi]|uniref:hypothetical protein n=1 Tax=Nonomuraea phyllanthi TaxID=2219224 RepID=UPI0012930110|nr:hypothetical protein [Nonomuraea phyllanthi]
MVRWSQVEKLKKAVREYEKAVSSGNKKEAARCYAVVNAVYRNCSQDEIDAATGRHA